jgi:hypothetical protein
MWTLKGPISILLNYFQVKSKSSPAQNQITKRQKGSKFVPEQIYVLLFLSLIEILYSSVSQCPVTTTLFINGGELNSAASDHRSPEPLPESA